MAGRFSYQNPFNEMISQAAFDGSVSSIDFSSTSPGVRYRRAIRQMLGAEKDTIQLYKTGSVFGIGTGVRYQAFSWQSCFCPGLAVL